MRYIADDLRGKTILITGGAGFIGSSLAFHFQEQHPEARVVVLDSFRSGERLSNGNLKSFGHFKNLIGFTGEVISGCIGSDATTVSTTSSTKRPSPTRRPWSRT